jgi:hypothetical protein
MARSEAEAAENMDMEMEGEEGEEMDELDGDEAGDGAAQGEYKKKEFVARPIECPETESAVKAIIVKPARSLIRMRVTKQRKDFAAEMGCLEKDPADNTYDLKPAQRT